MQGVKVDLLERREETLDRVVVVVVEEESTHTHTHHPAIHTTHSYLIPATGTLASGPRPQK